MKQYHKIGVYVALILGLMVAPCLGQTNQQAENESRETENKQTAPEGSSVEEKKFSVPIKIIEDESTTNTRKRREHESEKREIRDLIAQEGMNAATQSMDRATQRMAKYAFWSTFLVLIGTVLLFFTLLLTWMANRAAQAAVEVTREIGNAQARAYIAFVDFSFTRTMPVEKQMFRLYIKIKNTGQTPARGLFAWAIMDAYIDKPLRLESQIFDAITVAAEAEKWLNFEFDPADINPNTFSRGEYRFDFNIFIRFKDVFSETFRESIIIEGCTGDSRCDNQVQIQQNEPFEQEAKQPIPM